MDALTQVKLQLARRAPLVASDYLFYPDLYLTDVLGVAVVGEFKTFVRDVTTSWLHMHQREAIRRGLPVPHRGDIDDWVEGEPIPNTFCLSGGHKLGKSFDVAGLTSWVVHVSPKIVGCIYAPKVDQTARITWRYVDKFLRGSGSKKRQTYLSRLRAARMGGENSPELKFSLDRRITSQATNSGVRVQGSHEAVGFHVFEEAEGIEDIEVFDAVRSLTSDGISLWILCANPASSSSPFAKLSGDRVKRYEMSCLDHPNVATGDVVVPGAVTRDWVEAQLEGRGAWAVEVDGPDPERDVFSLPWLPGRWWKPRPPWYWRVLGVSPPTTAADAAVSAALLRRAASRDWRSIFEASDPTRAVIGVDCARGGEDAGVIARRWRGCVEVRGEIHDRDSSAYLAAMVEELSQLLSGGCREVEVRIDGGGGYGGALVDGLRASNILDLFKRGGIVEEVHFGGASYDLEVGADWVSCAYIDVGEDAAELAVVGYTPELEEDLCSRKVRWVTRSDGDDKRDVRQLERKPEFHRRFGRSPDRGDAVALACARRVRPEEDRGVLEAYGRVRF